MSGNAELMAIYAQLTSALIEATPEWWSHATLELVAPPEGLGSGLSHTISNGDYPQDVVVATDEILEATRLFELDSVKRADSWNRCIFRIRQEGDAWKFTADYERN